jgi:hypothetical protein
LKLSRGLAWVVAILCLSWASANAQIAIYGTATGSTLQFQETPHMYGATFGFYYQKPVGKVAMGADFRGVMVKRGGTTAPNSALDPNNGSITDTKLDEGNFGFRISTSPHVLPFSLMPYAEALTGLGYWRGGIAPFRQDKSHGMFQVVVGVDVPVYRAIQWRVAEFSYARVGAQPGFIEPMSFSTGIVVQLPPRGASK